MKNNLNLERLQKELETAVFEAVDEIMDIAKLRLEEKTPEDKMDLVHWYKKQPLEKKWKEIKGVITNNVPHGIYVEFGLSKDEGIPTWWKAYNYHKPKGVVFYRWVWARMVTKTYDQDRDEMFKILENKTKNIWQ